MFKIARDRDAKVEELIKAVSEGRVYIRGKKVVAVYKIPSRLRYKLIVVYEDGSNEELYPSDFLRLAKVR